MTALDHRPAIGPHGPYDTFADADKDVDAVIFLGKPGDGVLPKLDVEQAMRNILTGSITAAHVALGEHDRRVVDLLGQLEPQFIVAFAGLIERAYAAGQDSILGGEHHDIKTGA